MNVKHLKELLKNVDEGMEVFIRNTINPVGDIEELQQIECSSYVSFGQEEPCLILNTYSSKDLEEDSEGMIVDFLSVAKMEGSNVG